jgi:hypothetical protein
LRSEGKYTKDLPTKEGGHVVNLETGTPSLNNAPRQRLKQSWIAAATQRSLVLVLTFAFFVALAGCGGVRGKYADANNAVTLELRSGGGATFSFAGQTAECTYVTKDDQVTLDCMADGGKMTFNVQKDGTLVGPPGSLFPPLKKK